MLKDFTVSARSIWSGSSPFGGGHTLETDPTRRGWLMTVLSAELALFGRRGRKGCFSVQPLTGKYDIAVYDELKPEELTRSLKAKEPVTADSFSQVPAVSGWLLQAILDLERFEASESPAPA